MPTHGHLPFAMLARRKWSKPIGGGREMPGAVSVIGGERLSRSSSFSTLVGDPRTFFRPHGGRKRGALSGDMYQTEMVEASLENSLRESYRSVGCRRHINTGSPTMKVSASPVALRRDIDNRKASIVVGF